MNIYANAFTLSPIEELITFQKGGSAPPPPAPPAPPPTAKEVEVRQAERDTRRQALKRRGQAVSILAGSGEDEGKSKKTLLGG